VSTLEASRFKEGRLLSLHGRPPFQRRPALHLCHRRFRPELGPLHAGLPNFGSTRCLREDIENENLLFCGTEFAIFASINQGVTWTKINNNLPTVAIHEVAIHPTAGEIAVATHGRSLWIMDVTALRQMKSEVLAKEIHLFKPNTAIRGKRWSPPAAPIASLSAPTPHRERPFITIWARKPKT